MIKQPTAIAVTGANGFIGTHLIPYLIFENCKVHAIVRSEKKGEPFKNTSAQICLGDISDVVSLEQAFEGVDVVIHLVAIIAEEGALTYQKVIIEGTRNVIAAAKRAGVKRILYVSGLGVERDAVIGHFRAKWQAEQIIISSGLEYIIFRPSFVLGSGDYFTMDFVRQIKSGEIDIYGDGEYQMQPVDIQDFVKIFHRASVFLDIQNKIFDVGGPVPISYNQLIELISNIIGIKCTKNYLSIESASPAIISPDELYILTHDYICDPGPIIKSYSIQLTPLEETFRNILNIKG